jgi:hypothetical protein
MEPGRELRGTKADNTAKKYRAFTKTFDNGLKSVKQIFDHMVSSTYTSQSSWGLYKFFVFDQNTSEGICDVLLAVSEAMRQFAPGTSVPESALVELGKYTSQQRAQVRQRRYPRSAAVSAGLRQEFVEQSIFGEYVSRIKAEYREDYDTVY